MTHAPPSATKRAHARAATFAAATAAPEIARDAAVMPCSSVARAPRAAAVNGRESGRVVAG